MAYTMNDETARRKRQLEELEARGVDTTYKDKSESLLDAYLNREAFQYDMNKDPAYNAYRNQYTREGKQAMQDTIATASGLTGGFANSYAVQAGQGAYQSYLDQLNDRIPELYQAAYSRYQQEGTDMYNKYAAANDYYNNLLNDYYTNRNYYSSAYENAYNRDYTDYQNGVAQSQWAAEMAEKKRQYDMSLDENKRQADRDHDIQVLKQQQKQNTDEFGKAYKATQKAIEKQSGKALYNTLDRAVDNGTITWNEMVSLLAEKGITDIEDFITREGGLAPLKSKWGYPS